MRLENLQRNNIQGPLMGCLQIHRASMAGVDGVEPRSGTHAPPVPGLQTRKTELWSWGDEIVALIAGKVEKGFVDDAANGMGTTVAIIGVAATVTVPARQR